MQNPLAHTIAEACERARIGRTAMYELINTGQLSARKRGRRTLILDVDLVRYVQSLPLITKQSGTGPPTGSGTDHKDGDATAREKPSRRAHRGSAS
jgi:excisionase family DNA binding protein